MRERVEELFHAVADLSPEARTRYFAQNDCGENTRSELEALLLSDACSGTTFDRDIADAALLTLARYELQDVPCGPYRLRSLIGRGGMGSVYLAERADGELSQRVAVKLLQPGADTPDLRQRFL